MTSCYEKLRAQERQITHAIKATLNFAPAMIGVEQVIYASSPITTGKRMYDLFRAHGVTSVDALKTIDPNFFERDIMQANIADGRNFGEELRKQGNRYVIVPGEFFGPGWAQEHYMSLWKQIIKRHAREIRFNKKWNFSNGSAEEFLIGLENGLPLIERGATTTMTQKEGLAKIQAAIDIIGKIGVEPKVLLDTAREIELYKPRTVIDLK